MQEEISQVKAENSQLAEELARLEGQAASYESFQTNAVILTVSNVVRDGSHHLMIYQGNEKEELDNIQMGTDKTENTKARIGSLVSKLVEQAENQPVYICFYCDKSNIYTVEYMAVCQAFNELQETNKEVFFKVMQEE